MNRSQAQGPAQIGIKRKESCETDDKIKTPKLTNGHVRPANLRDWQANDAEWRGRVYDQVECRTNELAEELYAKGCSLADVAKEVSQSYTEYPQFQHRLQHDREQAIVACGGRPLVVKFPDGSTWDLGEDA